MTRKILLPKIEHFDLVGFRPIFNTDIHMKIGDGPNIVLGGNGLGKTTIMQAITYCLTGGTSTIEDEEKREKWDHKYFRDRMDQSAIKSAYVEVSFSFQTDMYSVRRGFSNNRVIAFRQNKSDWIDSSEDAHKLFLKAITNDGNYKSEDDFAFIVHRLLYLPESRRDLVWDVDVQLRTLMLLNQDIQSESDFRQRRKEIKELDSDIRHIHVAIGVTKNQIEKSEQPTTQPAPTNSTEEENHYYEQLAQQLHGLTQRRADLERKLMAASDSLSATSTEIEKLRDEEENAEATLISNLLREHESTSNLALSKLRDRGICPACGTKQKTMQDEALEHLRKHQCMLCGSDEPQANTPLLSTLQSQIHERVSAQKILERKYLDVASLLNTTKKEASRLEFELNRHWYKSSHIGQIERQENVKMGEDPIQQLKKLQHKEKDYAQLIQERKGELERDYIAYNSKLSARLETLRNSYEYYATKFLGTKCSLSESKIDQQIQLTYYIPEFNGKTRASPDACSEAQRFFLDIAFRMALIDFANSADGSGTTFICETPETALDYSYIDNVVDMFQAFSDRKHSLLVSSNIQRDSIASKLVSAARSKKKKSNIINLLKIGQLSDVQMKAKSKLDEIAKEITGEA